MATKILKNLSKSIFAKIFCKNSFAKTYFCKTYFCKNVFAPPPPSPEARMLWPLANIFSPTIIAKGGRGRIVGTPRTQRKAQRCPFALRFFEDERNCCERNEPQGVTGWHQNRRHTNCSYTLPVLHANHKRCPQCTIRPLSFASGSFSGGFKSSSSWSLKSFAGALCAVACSSTISSELFGASACPTSPKCDGCTGRPAGSTEDEFARKTRA